MALIHDEAQARRLARAVVADIRLYNAEALAAGTAGQAIEEGRALFNSRVDPRLQGLFDEALSGVAAVIPRAAQQRSPSRVHPPLPVESGDGRLISPIALAVLIAVALGAWFYFLR